MVKKVNVGGIEIDLSNYEVTRDSTREIQFLSLVNGDVGLRVSEKGEFLDYHRNPFNPSKEERSAIDAMVQGFLIKERGVKPESQANGDDPRIGIEAERLTQIAQMLQDRPLERNPNIIGFYNPEEPKGKPYFYYNIKEQRLTDATGKPVPGKIAAILLGKLPKESLENILGKRFEGRFKDKVSNLARRAGNVRDFVLVGNYTYADRYGQTATAKLGLVVLKGGEVSKLSLTKPNGVEVVDIPKEETDALQEYLLYWIKINQATKDLKTDIPYGSKMPKQGDDPALEELAGSTERIEASKRFKEAFRQGHAGKGVIAGTYTAKNGDKVTVCLVASDGKAIDYALEVSHNLLKHLRVDANLPLDEKNALQEYLLRTLNIVPVGPPKQVSLDDRIFAEVKTKDEKEPDKGKVSFYYVSESGQKHKVISGYLEGTATFDTEIVPPLPEKEENVLLNHLHDRLGLKPVELQKDLKSDDYSKGTKNNMADEFKYTVNEDQNVGGVRQIRGKLENGTEFFYQVTSDGTDELQVKDLDSDKEAKFKAELAIKYKASPQGKKPEAKKDTKSLEEKVTEEEEEEISTAVIDTIEELQLAYSKFAEKDREDLDLEYRDTVDKAAKKSGTERAEYIRSQHAYFVKIVKKNKKIRSLENNIRKIQAVGADAAGNKALREDYEKQLKQKDKERTKIAEENAQLKEDNRAYEARIGNLEKRLEDNSTQYDADRKRLDEDYKNRLGEKDKTINEKNRLIGETNRAHEEALASQKKRIEELTEEFNTRSAEKQKDYEDSLAEKDQKFASLNTQFVSLDAELASVRESFAQERIKYEGELNAERKLRSDAEENYRKVSIEHSTLEAKVQSLDKQLGELKTQYDAEKKESQAKYDADKKDWESRATAKAKELKDLDDAYKTKIQEMQKEHKERVLELEDRVNNYRTASEGTQEEKAEALKKAQEQITKLQEEKGHLAGVLRAKNSEIDTYKERIEQLVADAALPTQPPAPGPGTGPAPQPEPSRAAVVQYKWHWSQDYVEFDGKRVIPVLNPPAQYARDYTHQGIAVKIGLREKSGDYLPGLSASDVTRAVQAYVGGRKKSRFAKLLDEQVKGALPPPPQSN